MTAQIATPEDSSEETGDDSSGEDDQNETLSGDEVVYDDDMDDDDDDNDSEDDDDDDDSDDSMHEDDVIVPPVNDQEIKVEFEAFPPSDSDLEGLTALLSRLFYKEHINLHEMAEWIIGHNYIGSVLKTNNSGPDDEDSDTDDSEAADLDDTVYGVTTAISLKSAANGPKNNFKKQVLQYLENNCKDGPVMDIVNNTSNSVGLILTERFVNIPPLLAPPMLKCLNKEIESAIKKKMPYNFTHYMIISKSFDVSAANNSGKKEKASKSMDGLPPCLEFINPEDEIFQQHADTVVSFPCQSEDLVGGSWGPKDQSMPQYRTVLLLSKAKFKSAVTNICSVFTVENMMSLMADNATTASQ